MHPPDRTDTNVLLNYRTLHELAKHLGSLDPNKVDIPQLAIALRNHIIPALREHSEVQNTIDAIRALIYEPTTIPTQTIFDIRSILNSERSNPEKLQKIKAIVDHALHKPPEIKIFFVTIHLRHEDSTNLYKKLYALCDNGKKWCERTLSSSDSSLTSPEKSNLSNPNSPEVF